MAQGGSSAQPICRFFMLGMCARGNDCRYHHDHKSKEAFIPGPCRYFIAGRCSFGEKCRFDHVKSTAPDIFPDKSEEPVRSSFKEQQKKNLVRESSEQSRPFKMVTLKKCGFKQSVADAEQLEKVETYNKKWVQAKDFIPGQMYQGSVPGSYAEAVAVPDEYPSLGFNEEEKVIFKETDKDLLCPYYALGRCPFEEDCGYAHGDECDMCGMAKLHPTNQELRESHIKECMEEHEQEMEIAFAIQESKTKECGICLENVMNKFSAIDSSSDQRFGIMENCSHAFCLSCIREWRKVRSAALQTHRGCPLCRTHSNFVIPSAVWVESPEKKQLLIEDYIGQLKKKPCQYFKQGEGECPFYDKCFYLHALPDGSIAPPASRKPRRMRVGSDGEVRETENINLWDFVEERDDAGVVSDYEIAVLLQESLLDF